MEFNVLQSSNSQNSYIFKLHTEAARLESFFRLFHLDRVLHCFGHISLFGFVSCQPLHLSTREIWIFQGGWLKRRMVFCPWPSNSKIRKPFGEDFRRFHSNLCCDLTWGLRRQLQGMCDAPCGAWRKLVCVLDEVAAGRTC